MKKVTLPFRSSNWRSLKVLKIMKLAVLFMFIAFIQVSATGYSQVNISVEFNNTKLSKVLKLIEKKSDYRFVYSNLVLKDNRKVSISEEGVDIASLLSKLFDHTDLTYVIRPNNLVLIKGLDEVVNEDEVNGTVRDASGSPLVGVTVQVKGTQIGSVTDENGNYSIQVPDNVSEGVLIFSSVGFLSMEIPIEGRSKVDAVLQTNSADLDEVVVVGYGEAKKGDVTGAVAPLTADRILDRPAVNVGDALQGKVSGLFMQNMASGEPGGRPMIRIRGVNSINTNNSPLFVVDGVVGVSDALTTINPNDIESINVLKDASATAIYGARGANGVIIITTKRGKTGEVQVDYNGYITLGFKPRKFNVLDADELMYVYLQAMNNGNKYGSIVPGKDFRGGITEGTTTFSEMPWLFEQVPQGSYLLDLMGKDGNYYRPRFNSNFEDSIYKTPSISHNHDVSIRGGSENAQFSLSLGYTDQQGLMWKSFFKRYSTRFTGDLKMTKWLDLSTNLSFIQSKKTDDALGDITRTTAEVWSIVPTKYPNDPDIYGIFAGQWGMGSDFNVGENWLNPIFRRSEEAARLNHNQVTGSFELTAHITDNLSLKSNFAIDFFNDKNNRYSGKLNGGDGSAEIKTANSSYWQNQEYLNYDNTFGDHHLNGLLGVEWSQRHWENLNASNSVFFSNFFSWHNLGAGAATRPVPSNEDGLSSLNSYFARINYGFKNKYLLTLTGRFDGSSKFGENHKYGFFPSVGLAWRISNENFIQDNVPAVSDLKLRLGYGETGNQEIGSYVTQAGVSASNIVMGGGTKAGIYPSSFGNEDLRWESTSQFNAGLDLSLWQNRVSFIFDYYYKKTTDMILQVPLPTSTSTGSVSENIGEVQNQGVELTLNSHNVNTPSFSWNTGITATHNVNRVNALGPTGAPIFSRASAGRGTSVIAIGYPIGSFWGLNRMGTYSTEEESEAARYGLRAGDLKYEDKDNDGQIDLIADGQVTGNAFPQWVIGFNNTFNYKNFDASIDFRIVLGVQKQFIHESAEDRQLVSGAMNTVLGAWRPDAQNSMIAQMRPGNGGAYYQSFTDTHTIEDASFLRGQNLTVGYTFDDSIIGRVGLSRLRLYLTATNWMLRTSVIEYDPAGSSNEDLEQDENVPNIDKYSYPNPSNITFGINVSF